MTGIPRLYAAASLKPRPRVRLLLVGRRGIPRLYAAASLKHSGRVSRWPAPGGYSAALCRGLIEARRASMLIALARRGIPRLYAAASLKRHSGRFEFGSKRGYSAALCRGLIEANVLRVRIAPGRRYSAALCRGLIEAARGHCRMHPSMARIPRLYAAASLKPLACGGEGARDGRIPRLYAAASLKHDVHRPQPLDRARLYSAALCRGLIEAGHARRDHDPDPDVFRGFMPRPH